MTIHNALASLAVRDVNSATEWYAALFDRPADAKPMPELAEWKFERGGWLQIYQAPERAGHGSFTLAVSDIEAEARKLQSLGIDVSQRTSNDKVKTIMITDPDGNHIALAEALAPGFAR